MLLKHFSSVRIAIIVGIALSILRFTGCAPMAMLDTRSIDYRILYRGPEKPTGDVVIVAIDEASVQGEGRWPWPRSLLARLLTRMCEARPLAIGLDLIHAEPSRPVDVALFKSPPETVDDASWQTFLGVVKKLPSDDSVLARAIRDCDRVVLGYFFDLMSKSPVPSTSGISEYNLVHGSPDGSGELEVRTAGVAVGNLPELADAASATGYLNTPPDLSDGYLRRLPLLLRFNDRYAIPMILGMIRVAYPEQPLAVRFEPFGVASVDYGDKSIAVDEAGRMTINPRGHARTFLSVSAAGVLNGQVPLEQLTGRFVILGLTATGLVDVRPMAFDGLFPGVEVQATALDNILAGDSLRQPRWVVLVEILTLLFFVLVLGKLLTRTGGLQGALWAVACVLSYLAFSQWLFVAAKIPLGLVYPVSAVVLTYSLITVYQFLFEQSERRRATHAFELYVDPTVARRALAKPGGLELGGESKVLTILFSDIRDFTRVAQDLDPLVLVEMLNAYFTTMEAAITANHGAIDKYIGDAVMAIWDTSLPDANHADLACRGALAMLAALEGFHALARARGWPLLQIGIGVHTGEMIVGNMGSANRLSYTVIGDNVNLCSRLEGLTKIYGVPIIASDATISAAGTPLAVRELDCVVVKGRSRPLRIFELLDGRGRSSGMQEEFAAGRAAYERREWREALARFESALKLAPDDGPCRTYVDRCRSFEASPPPDDWDGVTTMHSK